MKEMNDPSSGIGSLAIHSAGDPSTKRISVFIKTPECHVLNQNYRNHHDCKKTEKPYSRFFAAAVFAVLMMLNGTPTVDGLAVTLCGETALTSDPCDLPCNEEPSALYYNTSRVWDARNCNYPGSGCITCTVPAP